jgi:hypothetical protein
MTFKHSIVERNGLRKKMAALRGAFCIKSHLSDKVVFKITVKKNVIPGCIFM